jgi:hypothetical protein
VWVDTPELGLTYYRYDLPDGGRILAMEYLREKGYIRNHGEKYVTNVIYYLWDSDVFPMCFSREGAIVERLKELKVKIQKEFRAASGEEQAGEVKIGRIEKASFNGSRFHGGIKTSDLPRLKDEYRANALRVLMAGTTDHVVYCHIKYDADGSAIAADFYGGLEMDDDTFSERMSLTPDADFIGAVHRMMK